MTGELKSILLHALHSPNPTPAGGYGIFLFFFDEKGVPLYSPIALFANPNAGAPLAVTCAPRSVLAQELVVVVVAVVVAVIARSQDLPALHPADCPGQQQVR